MSSSTAFRFRPRSALIVAVALSTLGCGKRANESSASPSSPSSSSSVPSGTALVSPAPIPAPASAQPADASAEAPHQGVTVELGTGKIRVSAIAAGSFQVWLIDEHGKLLSPDGVKARLTLDVPGYPAVVLAPSGDHLKGKGPPVAVSHRDATVVVERSGKVERAHLTLHLETGPVGHHHEHEPLAASSAPTSPP